MQGGGGVARKETQQHLMEECTKIHKEDNLMTTLDQIFSNDPSDANTIANKLISITNIINGWEIA